jgi:hypothetical protein
VKRWIWRKMKSLCRENTWGDLFLEFHTRVNWSAHTEEGVFWLSRETYRNSVLFFLKCFFFIFNCCTGGTLWQPQKFFFYVLFVCCFSFTARHWEAEIRGITVQRAQGNSSTKPYLEEKKKKNLHKKWMVEWLKV